MRLNPITASEHNGPLHCPFCGEEYDSAYWLVPTNDEEFDTLTQDIGDVDDPVRDWVVCEECLQGYCGAVHGKNPTGWFKEKYPQLISDRHDN